MTHLWYLAYFNDRLVKTHYSPAQTRQIRAMRAQGRTRDAIAEATDIGYSSVSYVEFLDHLDLPGWAKED